MKSLIEIVKTAFRTFPAPAGWAIAAVLLLAGAAFPGNPAAAADPGAASCPAIFFSTEDLARAKDRAGRLPWARKVHDGIISAADRWIASPAPLPEGPTGYYHDYFCPQHGVLLRYDPARPMEHVCPTDGRIHKGPKLDAYWVTATIRSQLQAAVQCALAWRFTGREPYRAAAAGVLLRCAAHYRDRISGRSPRRWMWQSLDEAVYVLDAVKAHELLAAAGGLPDADRTLVLRDYLLPTARFLAGERRAIHNIHSWYNAAILSIALAAGDDGLVHFALGDREAAGHGFLNQLRRGVSAEGFWKEGSIGYHFYTLSSLEEQAIPARRLPGEFRDEFAILKAMFLAPLQLADAAWTIPPTNDSGPASLDQFLGHYEMAAGLFPEDPALAGFLAAAYRKTARERSGIPALFYGLESLPEGEAPGMASRCFPDAGFAVLRTKEPHPPGGEVYALFKFGPHGGGHGHFDKLSVAFHGLDRVLAPDAGTAGYSLPLTGSWYRQTLSHNTVVLDRTCQQPAAGILVSFRGEGPVQHAIASAGKAYPKASWRRAVFLADEGYLVILDRLLHDNPFGNEGPHTFDWAWHGYGDLTVASPALSPLADRGAFGARDGYDVPADLRSARAEGLAEALWAISSSTPNQPEWRKPGTSGSLRLLLWTAPGSEVFAGTAPGNPSKDTVPLVVVRQSGLEAFFRAVIEAVPGGSGPRVQKVEAIEDGLRVTAAGVSRDMTLASPGSDPPPAPPKNLRRKDG